MLHPCPYASVVETVKVIGANTAKEDYCFLYTKMSQ